MIKVTLLVFFRFMLTFILGTAISYLTHKVHHNIRITSVVMMASYTVGLLILFKREKINKFTAGLIVIFIYFYLYWIWPEEIMGNWNIQIGGHLISTFLIGHIITMIGKLIGIYLKKSQLQEPL